MPRSPLRDPNEEDSDDEDPQERLRTRTEGYDRSRHDRHYNAAANAYDMRRRCGCTDADISPLGCKAIWAGVFIAIVLFSLSIAALTRHTEAGHTDLDTRVKALQEQVGSLQAELRRGEELLEEVRKNVTAVTADADADRKAWAAAIAQATGPNSQLQHAINANKQTASQNHNANAQDIKDIKQCFQKMATHNHNDVCPVSPGEG